MNSKKRVNELFSDADPKVFGRRIFMAKSVGFAAGLSILAFPGIATKALEAQGNKSKEEILKELEAKVDKFMPMYRTCSQTSFAVLNEQFGLKADRAIAGLMPFAGGIVGRGETCGAVSGSILAIGFFIDQKGKDPYAASMKLGGLFFNGFEKEFGSTRCKEVVKHQFGRYYDFLNPEDQKLFMAESLKTGKCLEVVKKAVLIAGGIFLDNY